MSFNVLYIDNDTRDLKNIREAIKQQNSEIGYEALFLIAKESPEELECNDILESDIVISDVYFDDPKTKERDSLNRLNDIIDKIENCCRNEGMENVVPVIAYTGKGKRALEECLEVSDRLYDIWDKQTAGGSYVAWRLTKLSKEMVRLRPDALLQRKIRRMEEGAAWHQHVTEMAKAYGNGWTERDQADRAGEYISKIANEFGVREACHPLWNEVMQCWEPIERAAFSGTRGHARHVINVFWMGYYILHHELTQSCFSSIWREMTVGRPYAATMEGLDPMAALGQSWFLAGVFHDVANCVEKGGRALLSVENVLSTFSSVILTAPCTGNITPTDAAQDEAQGIWHEMGSIEKHFLPLWRQTVKELKPDSGVMGAVYLREEIGSENEVVAKEAGRAMAVHNLVSKLDANNNLLTWETDPITCLLLLCDQLQTWDRERGDHTINDDMPARAELLGIDIDKNVGRITIDIAINYIAPLHVEHNATLRERVRRKLEEILVENPIKVLNMISRPWPFDVNVTFWLSGKKLDTVFRSN